VERKPQIPGSGCARTGGAAKRAAPTEINPRGAETACERAHGIEGIERAKRLDE